MDHRAGGGILRRERLAGRAGPRVQFETVMEQFEAMLAYYGEQAACGSRESTSAGTAQG